MTFAYLKVLLGLSALTLRDTTGAIVWQVPGEVRDLRAAVSALMGTGITTQHVETLTTAIDRLSQETDDAQQETLLGN
jgi:hypothetical protein